MTGIDLKCADGTEATLGIYWQETEFTKWVVAPADIWAGPSKFMLHQGGSARLTSLYRVSDVGKL